MNIQIIKDRNLGFTDAQWQEAGKKATEAGHRKGGHAWWDHIRDTLGIPRTCCQ